MDKDDFLKIMRHIGARDTSAYPDGWTPKILCGGIVSVVSLLAQDVFGGELMRASLKDHSKYAYLRSHFWNYLPDGKEVDFTADQYSDLSYRDLEGVARSRVSVLESPDTQRRYTLLKERFRNHSFGIKTLL